MVTAKARMPSNTEWPTPLILVAGNKNPNVPVSGNSIKNTHLMPISPRIILYKIKSNIIIKKIMIKNFLQLYLFIFHLEPNHPNPQLPDTGFWVQNQLNN